MDNLSVSQVIEEYKASGMTHAELSIKSGVPIGTVHRILSGTTQQPRIDTLAAIHEVLKATPETNLDILLLRYFREEIKKKDRWICILALLCVVLFIILVIVTPKYMG